MRRIEIKAHPRARLEQVEDQPDGTFAVWTTTPPEKGLANDAITRLIAKHFGVATGRVTLLRGATSRNKLFKIDV